MSPPLDAPERKARIRIDAALARLRWAIRRRDEVNRSAGRGVAVCAFKLTPGHGGTDYLLFIDGNAVGVLEAKPAGHTPLGVERQANRYAAVVACGLGTCSPLSPQRLWTGRGAWRGG